MVLSSDVWPLNLKLLPRMSGFRKKTMNFNAKIRAVLSSHVLFTFREFDVPTS